MLTFAYILMVFAAVIGLIYLAGTGLIALVSFALSFTGHSDEMPENKAAN